MNRRTQFEDLSPELAAPLRETERIIQSYLQGLAFIGADAGRDPDYTKNHLLYYLVQDFIQSAVSVTSLGMEGLLSVAKRELRFIIESSIKLCFVQQKAERGSTIAEKIQEFDRELLSQRISIKNNLTLGMLASPMVEEFYEEVGRLYGQTSNYVHLTPGQINERITAVDEGRAVGQETPEEIAQLNSMASRSLAASLVLIFHSVPEWVAGEWLVESDGATVPWYFTASRFIAAIDSHFDYKHERKKHLADVITARTANIKF